MSCGMYRLDGHEPVQCADLSEWAQWFDTSKRIVAQDDLSDGTRVSTVFLGIDHNFSGGPPLLFETMIFGGANDGYQVRYSTWAEAEDGHRRALLIARSASPS